MTRQHSPVARPALPCAGQQAEISPIVRHKDATGSGRGEQVHIVIGIQQPGITSGHHVVTGVPHHDGDVQRHVLVEVEAGHRLGRVRVETGIDGALMLMGEAPA